MTFEYVEEDDAVSMAYHLLGGDSSIQPRGAGYQPAMDWILRLIPPVDPGLRIAAMLISAASALIFTLLLLALVFDKNPDVEKRTKVVLAVGLVVAAPEFLYLGLLYTPMLTGMCFAVAGHLLLRRNLRTWNSQDHSFNRNLSVLVPTSLLVVAGFFRWDLFLYLPLAISDIATDPKLEKFREGKRRDWKRDLTLAGGLTALATLALVIFDSTLFHRVLQAAEGALSTPKFPDGVAGFLGAQQTFFSPAMVLCLTAGMATTWRVHRASMFFYMLVISLMLLWPLWMSPKEILVFIPFIVLVFPRGLHFLWNFTTWKHSRLVHAAIVMLFIFPWLVGVRARYGDSAWGPGFELQRFDRAYNESTSATLTLGPGAACPTREGPRPLFGHVYCLLGGEWQHFVRDQASEHRGMIACALKQKIPLMTFDRSGGVILAVAAEQSFRTRDPLIRPLPPNRLELRTLVSPPGDTLMLARFRLFHSPDPIGSLQTLRSRLGTNRVVAYDYTSTIRNLYLISPNSMEALGKTSAVLNLDTLQADWQRKL